MPELAWNNGYVVFAGSAIGNLRECRLSWEIAAADVTTAGDSVENSLTLNRVRNGQIVISGLESDRTNEVLVGKRNTLIIFGSANTTTDTRFSGYVLVRSIDVGESYNDATNYSLTFGIETLPATPILAYVSTLPG